MRKIVGCLAVLLIVFSYPSSCLQATQTATDEQVYFSPKGGCTEAIVKNLDQAERSILVQAYSFTSKPIAEALIAAHKRGVKVKVLLDKSQLHGKGSKLDLLADAGIPAMIDTKHSIAHNKVMIIDGITVLTGSFNFTNAAEDKNAENLLVVRDKTIARKYRNNWDKHQKHSERYPI
ncbi:MAG: phospholipase [Omnitrophica bacterium RIFOXYB12_FULL_50_7]|nr:MAG: phospholipase [Omnitrophica bacterium RIFOXYB12_FULL_50_7]